MRKRSQKQQGKIGNTETKKKRLRKEERWEDVNIKEKRSKGNEEKIREQEVKSMS